MTGVGKKATGVAPTITKQAKGPRASSRSNRRNARASPKPLSAQPLRQQTLETKKQTSSYETKRDKAFATVNQQPITLNGQSFLLKEPIDGGAADKKLYGELKTASESKDASPEKIDQGLKRGLLMGQLNGGNRNFTYKRDSHGRIHLVPTPNPSGRYLGSHGSTSLNPEQLRRGWTHRTGGNNQYGRGFYIGDQQTAGYFGPSVDIYDNPQDPYSAMRGLNTHASPSAVPSWSRGSQSAIERATQDYDFVAGSHSMLKPDLSGIHRGTQMVIKPKGGSGRRGSSSSSKKKHHK